MTFCNDSRKKIAYFYKQPFRPHNYSFHLGLQYWRVRLLCQRFVWISFSAPWMAGVIFWCHFLTKKKEERKTYLTCKNKTGIEGKNRLFARIITKSNWAIETANHFSDSDLKDIPHEKKNFEKLLEAFLLVNLQYLLIKKMENGIHERWNRRNR